MATQTPIDKQLRDLRTLVNATRNGERLKRAEFEMLEPWLLDALRTLEFCRDNREAIREVLAASREHGARR